MIRLTRKLLRRQQLAVVILVTLVIVAAEAFVVPTTRLRAPAPNHDNYDVAVVGAGPGGIAASIQAARMGATVALYEPTDWIGGQMTAAGIGTVDEGNIFARKSGIYKEFVTRVVAYYTARHKSIGTCYYDLNAICVDPSVGQTILRQMLSDAGPNLEIFTGSAVSAVIKKGDTVTGLVVNGHRITTRVVIDGDEYGDILAQAGAEYRLGTGTSDEPDLDSCIQSMVQTAIIKYYPAGVPKALKFTSPPPGYTQELASQFAAAVRTGGADHFVSHTYSQLSFTSFLAARGYPDLSNSSDYNVLQQNGHTITRSALVSVNDFPLTGNLSVRYISDPTYRTQTDCDAKLLTLQFMYYLQHDMHQTNWSIANDEGYNTGYNQGQHCDNLKGFEAFENQMPQEPYVREGRRLVGETTLTGNEIAQAQRDAGLAPRTANSIAIGYYPMDLHACSEPLETAFDSPRNLQQQPAGVPFEIPLGTLIPIRVDGLLAVEKNISVSRQANGAIREQPIAMATGQAAGALAALAVEHHKQPRDISYQAVQQALYADGVITTF